MPASRWYPRSALLNSEARPTDPCLRGLPRHQSPDVRAGGAAVVSGRRARGRVALRQGARSARGRPAAFRPASVVNISAMSFGSLSGAALEVLNRGAALAGCLHNLVASAQVRASEVKLSQGAKPGLGGVLPGPKVSAEIAETRGVRLGQDCVNPSRHAEFSDPDSPLDPVELLAAGTGPPANRGLRPRLRHGQLPRRCRTCAATRRDGECPSTRRPGTDHPADDNGATRWHGAPVTVRDP